ncbi:hypothetical protein JOF44_001874 [Brachybacterium fresconis]|uniref:Uncharacterized protein n=1 Tax=Brachybacterium fresconis TaxID=173363 RepID=A0ABS4YJI9_9MICO|nr:hypothetical protein [Brachybacterium fresconis]
MLLQRLPARSLPAPPAQNGDGVRVYFDCRYS